VGGWGEIKIKAKLSPAEAGVWAELGKKTKIGRNRGIPNPSWAMVKTNNGYLTEVPVGLWPNEI
jgi:hypothetical protein